MGKQRESFIENFDGTEFDNKFNFPKERRKLKESLDRLKSMSVEEFTFYKKWEELRYGNFGDKASNISNTKRLIWRPTDFNDEETTIKEIENLDPEVIFVDENHKNYDTWNHLRMFCHTMEFNQNPGRFIRFLVKDKTSKKYLGVISLASDVIAITDRDNYIGWSSHNRLEDKKLAYSSIGSCIMATQPFGYNFLGGKLIACLVTSKVIRDTWKKLYGQTLVGITTTSLYGSYSMYNSLKWWHKCGTSSGKILIKPDQSCYDDWHKWIKENRAEEYNKTMTQKEGVSGPVTGAKLRVLSMMMSVCDIKQKDYVHGYERGVYYSCLYENSKEFLCGKIEENDLKIKPLISGDVKSIVEWWRPKAIERYRKLYVENNVKTKVLYYDTMINMSYDDAKKEFFNEVGR